MNRVYPPDSREALKPVFKMLRHADLPDMQKQRKGNQARLVRTC